MQQVDSYIEYPDQDVSACFLYANDVYINYMKFIESPVFTKTVRALLEDDEYRSLQIALLFRPEQGAVIPGSGGLRKIRWGAKAKGKRGGLRIIFHQISSIY